LLNSSLSIPPHCRSRGEWSNTSSLNLVMGPYFFNWLFWFLCTEFVKNLEYEPGRPVGYPAAQGQGHGRCFQYLVLIGTGVNSTADMVFDSAIACLADADTQGDQLLCLPIERTVLEGIFFGIPNFAKRRDAAAHHFRIVLFSHTSDLFNILEHRIFLSSVGDPVR